MKVLITGPDGLLGSNLVRELLHRKFNVSVLIEPGKDPVTLKDLPVNKYYGNILDKDAISEAIKSKDVVFHCAAATSVIPAKSETVRKVNVLGTENIVDLVLEHKVNRLIYVGTANSFSFGSSKDNPGREDTAYISKKYGLDYMDSKYEAQNLVLAAVKERNLPALVVNPTFMIGPFDSKPSSGAMILAIKNHRIPGYSNGGKNFIAVKDVAVAMANAIEKGRIGECYILGNHNLTYKEAFDLIARTIGVEGPRIKFPNFAVKSYGSINTILSKLLKIQMPVTKELAVISCENHYYSSDKAKRELDLPITPLETAIKESMEWFNQNNY
jgi:dihydroflavonol-4-reductase